MVPRIGKTSVGPGVGDCMVALMALAEVSGATDSGVGDALRLYRLFPVANRVNFREDAEDRWSASRAPVVALLPGLPVLRLTSSARSATRNWVPGRRS